MPGRAGTRAGSRHPRCRARARRWRTGTVPGTCCSRCAITTSRSGTGRRPSRAWSASARGTRATRRWSAPFRDADGKAPRHSFFFPGEQYAPEFLEPLGDLARRGFGEVELHLHHNGDTAATLRPTIDDYLKLYASHGHLSRDPDGRLRYAFIHGNWALANPMHDGRWCGVSEEMRAAATRPAATRTSPSRPRPDESQPAIVNQIYWPEGDLSRARCYERGTPARVGERRGDRILMIEGPLSLARRPGKLLPTRIENGGADGGRSGRRRAASAPG